MTHFYANTFQFAESGQEEKVVNLVKYLLIAEKIRLFYLALQQSYILFAYFIKRGNCKVK